MVFNSFSFAVFFALVLVLYAGMRSWRGRKVLLLVASYLFYAAWNPPLVSLLALSTAVDWGAARLMQRSEQAHVRRGALLLSLTTNLGMLALFKYSSFLLENFQGGLALVGVEYVAPAWSIVL
ncbi:MAG: MBOAT family protein, partial [Sandaracinaceae bacterium]